MRGEPKGESASDQNLSEQLEIGFFSKKDVAYPPNFFL